MKKMKNMKNCNENMKKYTSHPALAQLSQILSERWR